MRFYIWDNAKAVSNLRKHGVQFEEAIQLFDDPNVLRVQDRIEAGELRWQSIGLVRGVLLLMVAHTEDDDGDDEIIRIISARRASRAERRRYQANVGSGQSS